MPATGWYEWKGGGAEQQRPYYFHPTAKPLAFAVRASNLTRHSLVAEALGRHTVRKGTETEAVYGYCELRRSRCR